jgi:hypothetical protein
VNRADYLLLSFLEAQQAFFSEDLHSFLLSPAWEAVSETFPPIALDEWQEEADFPSQEAADLEQDFAFAEPAFALVSDTVPLAFALPLEAQQDLLAAAPVQDLAGVVFTTVFLEVALFASAASV